MDVTSVSHAVENAIRAGTQHQDKPTYMWLNPSQPNGYANASMIVQCGGQTHRTPLHAVQWLRHEQRQRDTAQAV